MTMTTLPMTDIPLIPTPSWYSDGMHWIGSLFHSAGADFDRPSFAPSCREPRAQYLAPEEFLFDVRSRMLGHL
jgi:hypothetical protein